MITRYEKIKQLTLEELAVYLVRIKFFTQGENNHKTIYYIGLDGIPYKITNDLLQSNKKWLLSGRYEKIKQLTLEELAEYFVHMEFFTQDKNGCKIKHYIGLSGVPHETLYDLLKSNRKWLSSEDVVEVIYNE